MIGRREVRNSVIMVGVLLILIIIIVKVRMVSGGKVLLILKICMIYLVNFFVVGWLSKILFGILISKVKNMDVKISIKCCCLRYSRLI